VAVSATVPTANAGRVSSPDDTVRELAQFPERLVAGLPPVNFDPFARRLEFLETLPQVAVGTGDGGPGTHW
jgi:hypothetical protein